MTTTNDTTGTADAVQPSRADHAAIEYWKRLDVPRYHQLNGCNFFLDRDRGLVIGEREDRRPLVRLTPDEVYGLLVFLRLPGVATLIERLEAQRQERWWRDYDKDQAEDEAKFGTR